MKNTICFLLFGLMGMLQMQAQENDSVPPPKYGPTQLISHYHSMYSGIGAFFNAGANSNALTSNFMRPFLVGGMISDGDKDAVRSRLKNFNLAGFDVNTGLKYMHYNDSVRFLGFKGMCWDVSITDNDHFDVLFSDNAFQTTFYGNKEFEGDTIQLADIRFQRMRYQKIEFGASVRKNQWTFALAGAYIKGEDHSSLNVRNARMYTAPFGQEIYLEANYSSHSSDTSISGIDAWSGNGASFDLGLQYHDSVWGTIMIEADNIGFITWNDRSIHRRVDSSYSFDGVHVNDLMDINDSIFNTATDSAESALIPNTYTKPYSTYLPGFVRLKFAQRFKKNWTVVSGAEIRIMANYAPRFFIEARKKWQKSEWTAQFNFGGYGGPGFGMSYSQYIKPVFFKIGSQQLEGFVLPNKAAGQHLYIGLVTVLK